MFQKAQFCVTVIDFTQSRLNSFRVANTLCLNENSNKIRFNLKISTWKGKQDFVKISKSDEPKLVLFAAHWCGYCSRFLDVARNYEAHENAEIILVDTDDPDESLWDDYKIRLVPTLIVLDSGKELFRREAVIGPGLREPQLIEALTFLESRSTPD